MKNVLVALVGGGLLVVSLVAGLVLGFVVNGIIHPTQPAVSAEEEYYRGAFDVCEYTLQESGTPNDAIPSICETFVGKIVHQDWYGEPTPSWTWPLPPTYSVPEPQPTPVIGVPGDRL